MAQAQQIVLAEFIEKVKREQHRKDNPFYLDDETPITTNYGHKLNRNARNVRRGRLNSHALFQHTIQHAGYQRDVISINPQYYTPDGELIEDDDEVDDEDELLDENIYRDIKLEDLLAPLASAADLPSHPSLSQPYKERGLEEMIKTAEEQLHKQQDILATIKNLYVGFRGDVAWAPMGLFRDAQGERILSQNVADVPMADPNLPIQNGTSESAQRGVTQPRRGDAVAPPTRQLRGETNGIGLGIGQDEAIESIERTDHAGPVQINGQFTTPSAFINGDGPAGDNIQVDPTAQSDTANTAEDSLEETESNAPAHRMTTRRQANQRTPSPSYVPSVHPWFTFPSEAIPDPHQGLPENMAAESALLLSTYISKQDEVVRQLRELHEGLLSALRMRQNAWKWTRAEAHVGEMSDNEDWVDLEEWGIDPRDARIKYTKGQQEEDQVDEEEERRGKRVRRAGGRQKE